MDAWMKAIEDGLQKQKVFTQNVVFHSSSRIEEAVNIAKQAESKAIEAESKAIEANTKANVAAALASEAETRANTQFASIQVLKNSNSWKVTAPLRFAGRTLRSVKIGSGPRNAKLLLQHSALYIARRPRLKRFVLAVLKKFPKVKNRLAMLRHQQATGLSFAGHAVPRELAQLSSHARRIHFELNNTINKSTEGGR
jgi:O-antigen chain-terminating methyltransferase